MKNLKGRENMEKFKQSFGKIIVCVCEVAVGIVLLIHPETFTKTVIIAAGILLCVLGALAVISYFRADPAEAALSQDLVRGILMLLIGIFFVYRSDSIKNAFDVVITLYGVAALVVGAVKLQWTVDMIRLKIGQWQVSAVASAMSIILGIIIISSPSRSMWTFIAISLIVTGAVDAVNAILGQKNRSVSGD